MQWMVGQRFGRLGRRRSVKTRGLLVSAAFVAAGLIWPSTGAAARDYGAEAREIVEAFTTVGDVDVPVEDRIEALEDGDSLRKILAIMNGELTIYGAVKVELSGKVFRDITVHRLHENAAEVDFAISYLSHAVTSLRGVAVHQDGRWKMSRGTLCTMLADWTEVRCPGSRAGASASMGPFGMRVRSTAAEDGSSMLPLTFPDGSTAEIVLPPDTPEGWRAEPRGALELHRGEDVYLYFQHGKVEARQPVRTYRGAKGKVVLDVMQGLLIPAGDWTINAYVTDLDEASRRLIARHLTGTTTDDGFLVLHASAPLVLGSAVTFRTVKSALATDDLAFPLELSLSRSDSHLLLAVTLGRCPDELQHYEYDGYLAIERCMPGGNARIAVEGNDLELVRRLLDGVIVRRIKQAGQQEAALA
jgi:hypothetical protein